MGTPPSAYPVVAVTVDVVLLTIRHGRLSVLLVERGGHPCRGHWALPGGFVDADETLDQAARRELSEETAMVVVDQRGGDNRGGDDQAPHHLEQLRTYGDPGRDPRLRVVSVAYLALMPDAPSPTAGSDAARARFWAIDDLPDAAADPTSSADIAHDDTPPIAFDHGRIIADAVERTRAKLEYTTLACAFVDDSFTLGELRRVYETVWGVPLHAANFRRKVLATEGFVAATGDMVATEGRPAQLFRAGHAATLHPPFLRPEPD